MKKLLAFLILTMMIIQLSSAQFRIKNNLVDNEPQTIRIDHIALEKLKKSSVLVDMREHELAGEDKAAYRAHNLSHNKRTTACGVDTVKFTLAKTTAIQALDINNSTSAESAGQYFNAAQEITISGFNFYAYKIDLVGGPTMDVLCEVYLAGADSLPLGAPLVVDTVSIDTLSTLSLPNLRKHAVFNTPVVINQPFVLVVRNASSTALGLVCNDFSVGDGALDNLSSVELFGTWASGLDVTVGSFPFDADWLFEPIVTYDLSAGFVSDPYCLPSPGAAIAFQNTSSPIFFDKMYNQLVFSDDSTRSTWDFGDGSAGSDEKNPTHIYNELEEYEVMLTDSMTGWTSSCVEDTMGVLPYCGVQTQIYCEDFQGVALQTPVTNTVTGGAMTQINYDSLIPNSNSSVNYFGDDAWLVNVDRGGTDTVGVSISYYSPAGQSDDWMITPAIDLPPGDSIILSWRDRTFSSGFPDGYQIYVSTTGTSYNDMINGTLVFEIPAAPTTWQMRSVDLSVFAGQTVYIGYRNNSINKWLLFIDDIKIGRPIDFNDLAAVNPVDPIDEYTATTARQMTDCDFVLGVDASNVGIDTVENVFAQCNFYLNNNPTPFATVTGDTLSSLAVGQTSALTFSESVAPNAPGLYTLEYIIRTTDFQPNTINDTVKTEVFINSKYMARDDGNVDNTIGVGGNIGKFGQGFELKQDDIVSGLNVYMQSPNPGDFFRIFVYETDTTGMPTNLLVNSSFLTVDSSFVDTFSFIPFGQLVHLEAGNYLFGVDQVVPSSLTIGASSERYTPQASWVKIDTDPWEPLETSFFNNSLMVRPVFEKIDIGITSIENESGRVGFPSELSNADTIKVEITNFDTASLAGFDVSYQINGGAVITEVYGDTLPGMTSASFAFAQTADLSIPSSDLHVWTSIIGDAALSNDTSQVSIYSVENRMITGTTCFDFEELEALTIVADTTWAVSGSDYLDYFPAVATGTSRLRTMADTGYAQSGSKALTLDVNTSGSNSLNHLVFNFDMSAFDVSQGRLDVFFSLMDHAEETNPNDKISIRGSASDTWIDMLSGNVYNAAQNGVFNEYILALSDSLATAGQNFSSTFQLRVGQVDNFQSTSILLSDGITIDDFCFIKVDSVNGRINGFVNLASIVCEDLSAEICIEIENIGNKDITSANIELLWPGGMQSYPYTDTLTTYETQEVCLAIPMSFDLTGNVNFDVELNVSGDTDLSDNMASTVIEIIPTANPPLLYGDQFLDQYGDSTTLYALVDTAFTRVWYDSIVEGNVIFIGDTFHTGPVDTLTTYYVSQDAVDISNVGPVDNTIGNSFYFGPESYGLNFETDNGVLLQSVRVYPQSAGTVFVRIEGSGGTFVSSFDIVTPEPDGNVLILNQLVPPGNDWTMTAVGSTTPLYLNDSGVVYPYISEDGSIRITGATTSGFDNYYFYFYDMVVLGGCPSARTPITVQKDCPPTLSLSGISTDNQTYRSSGTLESNQLIIGGHTVDYSAELEILLNAEFEVELGAEFEAIIGNCGN